MKKSVLPFSFIIAYNFRPQNALEKWGKCVSFEGHFFFYFQNLLVTLG
jgi:hypothetical protein